MGYNTHHNQARLIFRHKHCFEDGELVEMKAWAVPRSPAKPEGLKYSLVYVDSDGRRILGYDNAEGKGHHRHVGEEETPFVFEGLDALTARFLDEVSRLRGIRQ